MSALIPFFFGPAECRAITDDRGDPWFVASDVAEVLGYRNGPDMTRMLDADEAAAHKVRSRSENGVEQDREMTVISESGLYACILKSRRPEAVDFRKWVTSEVLPAIRKTGKYAVPVNTGDLLVQMAIQLRDQGLKLGQIEHQQQALANRVEVLSGGEKFITVNGWLNMRGYRRDTRVTSPLGVRAAKYCRAHDQYMGQGWSNELNKPINTYPSEILDFLYGDEYPMHQARPLPTFRSGDYNAF